MLMDQDEVKVRQYSDDAWYTKSIGYMHYCLVLFYEVYCVIV